MKFIIIRVFFQVEFSVQLTAVFLWILILCSILLEGIIKKILGYGWILFILLRLLI